MNWVSTPQSSKALAMEAQPLPKKQGYMLESKTPDSERKYLKFGAGGGTYYAIHIMKI